METFLRVLLLGAATLLLPGCASLWPFGGDDEAAAAAEEPETVFTDSAEEPSPVPPRVIDPQVERREIKPAKIDTENWEAGLTVGSLSVEDFEVNVVYGARIAYHINEDFFAEGIIGQSDAGLSSFERLSGGASSSPASARACRAATRPSSWLVSVASRLFGAMPNAAGGKGTASRNPPRAA